MKIEKLKFLFPPFIALFFFMNPLTALAGEVHNLNDPSSYDAKLTFGANTLPGTDDIEAVGDINGDGIDDMIIPHWTGSGEVSILFGSDSLSGDIDMTSAYNVKISGCRPEYNTIIAGDVNGDNTDDLVIGCYNSNDVYVFFSEIFTAYGLTIGNDIDLTTCSNCYSVKYASVPVASDWTYVFSVGDLNEDGLSDLVIPYGNQDTNGSGGTEGAVYVMFSTLFDDYIGSFDNDLDIDTDYNIRFRGDDTDGISYVAYYVGALTKDVNGDGYSDLITGSNYCSEGECMWVIYSSILASYGETTANDLPLSSDEDNYNLNLYIPTSGGFGFYSNYDVGDLNGDNMPDIAVGEQYADYNGSGSGSVWVIFSTIFDDYGVTTSNDIDVTDSSNFSIRYDGVNADNYTGGETRNIKIGDVNFDGLGDLFFGADWASPNGLAQSGSAWVMFSTLLDDFGETTGNAPYVLSDTSSFSVHLSGEAAGDLFSFTGGDMNAIVDIDGNGIGDLFSVARYGNSDAGAAYIFYQSFLDDYGETVGNQLWLGDTDNFSDMYTCDPGDYCFSYGCIEMGDVNGDGIDDMVLAGSSDSVFVLFGGSMVIPAPVGIDVVLASDEGVDVGNVRQGGWETIRIKEGSAVIADIDTNFIENTDLDWSSIIVDSEAGQGKAIASSLTSAPGTADTFALYVPRLADSNEVYVCPDAMTLEDVTESCSGGYSLGMSDSNLSLTNIGGVEYWRVDGLTGSGAMNYTIEEDLTETGQGVVFVLLGGVALLGFIIKRKRFIFS